MKLRLHIFLFCLLLLSCESKPEPKEFSSEALSETLITLKGDKVTFQDMLNRYKSKTIVLDTWASWCADCLKAMPKVKATQLSYPKADYVFLSMDKSYKTWKEGIKRHKVTGQHYFVPSGWNGSFAKFIDLDWIPRYMVVDVNQKISVFNAVMVNDAKIIKCLTQ
jgi:thiol-disulfide isomerase/thioredoxin